MERIMKQLTPLKVEYRESTGYCFVHVEILDDGIKKHLDVYFDVRGGKDMGLEVYQGQNYVVGSKDRSYSRNYKHFKGIPDKYVALVKKMKKEMVATAYGASKKSSKTRRR